MPIQFNLTGTGAGLTRWQTALDAARTSETFRNLEAQLVSQGITQVTLSITNAVAYEATNPTTLTPMLHDREKSDSAMVAVKPANKAERSAAELVERRVEAKGNADQQCTCRAQYRESVPHALVACATPQQQCGVRTRGGSRMRESRTYGSVRGARSNARPYRDP